MNEIWKVSSNVIDGRSVYGVFRTIDPEQIEHSGNREVLDYFDSLEDAEQTAEAYNRAQVGAKDRSGVMEAELLIEDIKANPLNPRKTFNAERLEELADSIRQMGVLQPLIVARDAADPGKYYLIAGERRLRAAAMAGLERVPVVYRSGLFVEPETQVVAMLIENLQREDLDPIEEARAFAALTKEHGWTQTDLAAKIGVSQSHIANRIRLLNLPEAAQEAILEGKLTVSAGKELATLAKVPAAMEAIDEAVAGEQDERDVLWQARRSAFETSAPLHRDSYAGPDFDTKGCHGCEDRVMLPGINIHDGSGGLRPYCMGKECWREKQRMAEEEEAERSRQQAIDTKGDNDGILDLGKMSNDSYEFIDEGGPDEDCAACEHRAQGRYSWTKDGHHHEICLKPACHKAKGKEIARERAQLTKELREAHEERVDSLISSFYPQGIFEDDDPDSLDYRALVYITTQAVVDPPYSSSMSKAKVRTAVFERYGWEQPEGLGWDDEVRHLVGLLGTLTASGLLRVIYFAMLRPVDYDDTVFGAVYGGEGDA